ncbi:MAG: DUF3127 domain-containing protein [Alistipes sp.]
MEFEGKVVQILPVTRGTSSRGEWQRQDVIFEIQQEFSRKVCVTFFNKEADAAKLHIGEIYVVSVNVESREYNGKWYTDVREWRVQPKSQAAGAGAPMPDMPPLAKEEPTIGTSSEVDDLPF